MPEGYRIETHPVIRVPEKKFVEFTWNGMPLTGAEGEMLSTALFANGIRSFGTHPRDGSSQGIFCANGQCSQCMVLVDGIPVKSCMTPLEAGMRVSACNGIPELPGTAKKASFRGVERLTTDVLIIGAGPAGLSAAIELGMAGVKTLLVDDKAEPGGKLLLQTHKFFGSVDDCYAGTRGVDIAKILADRVAEFKTVRIMLNTTACAVFSDRSAGLVTENKYSIVSFNRLLVAAGAREKSLPFPGCTLPGVYGAGAFQTLVNRDLVKSASRLFVVGGGNVGLIAAYHAIQAGIEVAGLVEACPSCGGYKVHEDKLRRLGVPVFLSHTVLRVEGRDRTEKIVIARLDENFKPLPGTEKSFDVDTVLIAVGLNPVNEFYEKAREFGFEVYAAGDADEIAEASSAMFSGKIAARKILNSIRKEKIEIPPEWETKATVLKSRPGRIHEDSPPPLEKKIFPRIHCFQEIPCNPCVTSCPKNCIKIPDGSLTGLPVFEGECSGCLMCVAICPGLAITLVDARESIEKPLVTLPFEMGDKFLKQGEKYRMVDRTGSFLGLGTLVMVRQRRKVRDTHLVTFEVPGEIANLVAGFEPVPAGDSVATVHSTAGLSGAEKVSDTPQHCNCEDEKNAVSQESKNTIICRCERVSDFEIRSLIRDGITDMNQIKAMTRAGMGACGGKTCTPLILKIMREEKIKTEDITPATIRPLFVEVSFEALSSMEKGERK